MTCVIPVVVIWITPKLLSGGDHIHTEAEVVCVTVGHPVYVLIMFIQQNMPVSGVIAVPESLLHHWSPSPDAYLWTREVYWGWTYTVHMVLIRLVQWNQDDDSDSYYSESLIALFFLVWRSTTYWKAARVLSKVTWLKLPEIIMKASGYLICSCATTLRIFSDAAFALAYGGTYKQRER